jgi:hypothetical protein
LYRYFGGAVRNGGVSDQNYPSYAIKAATRYKAAEATLGEAPVIFGWKWLALTQPPQPFYHYASLGRVMHGCPWGWTVEGSIVGEPLYTNASAMAAQRGVDFKENLGALDE